MQNLSVDFFYKLLYGFNISSSQGYAILPILVTRELAKIYQSELNQFNKRSVIISNIKLKSIQEKRQHVVQLDFWLNFGYLERPPYLSNSGLHCYVTVCAIET